MWIAENILFLYISLFLFPSHLLPLDVVRCSIDDVFLIDFLLRPLFTRKLHSRKGSGRDEQVEKRASITLAVTAICTSFSLLPEVVRPLVFSIPSLFLSLFSIHHQIANYLFLTFFLPSRSFTRIYLIHWLRYERRNERWPLDRVIAVLWLLISLIQSHFLSLSSLSRSSRSTLYSHNFTSIFITSSYVFFLINELW